MTVTCQKWPAQVDRLQLSVSFPCTLAEPLKMTMTVLGSSASPLMLLYVCGFTRAIDCV